MNTEIIAFNQATHAKAYALISEDNFNEAKLYIATLIGSAAANHPESAYYLHQKINVLNEDPSKEDFYYLLSEITNYLAG